MARTRQRSAQNNWGSFANNIKRAKTSSGVGISNGVNTNLGPQGAQISFTVETDCVAFVVVLVACRSTTDFEHKPQIWLDGSLAVNNDSGASVNGTASNRAFQRTCLGSIPLTAGTHTLSAGITVSSSTSASVNSGEAEIMAIVLGNVTA